MSTACASKWLRARGHADRCGVAADHRERDPAAFPHERFRGGIQRGVDDIVQVLTGDAEDFKRRAAEADNPPAGAAGWGQFIFIILFIGLWLYFASRSRRRGRYSNLPWIVPMGGGFGNRGGWGGGGFGGGGWGGGSGGGGFSGGGGSFGGGGASGGGDAEYSQCGRTRAAAARNPRCGSEHVRGDLCSRGAFGG
jgi:hypothetical protein